MKIVIRSFFGVLKSLRNASLGLVCIPDIK